MAESIEPRQSILRKTLALVLHLLLVVAIVYVAFFYDPSGQEDTITPGELREVLRNFRENQTERLERDVEETRRILAEMNAIRDKWIREAQITEELDAVLSDEERAFRSDAQQNAYGSSRT